MADASVMPDRTALVLAGGNALGAFEAGAYRALHDRGVRPDWIVGSSVGAVNGAIIAGNPVDGRIEALRRFWSAAAVPGTGWAESMGACGAAAERWAGQLHTLLFGRPTLFVPNFPGMVTGWANRAEAIGVYDLTPLRRTLEQFVDFELLNQGGVRLTALAVDLESGDEVLFDTRRDRIGPEHILASAALMPDFQPIEIDGRLLGDGGFRANLPVEVVLREADEHLRCFTIDVLSAQGERCTNILEAIVRRQELLVASQSRLSFEAHRRENRLRRMLRAMIDLVPEGLRNRPEVRSASAEADRANMTLVRLAFRSGDDIGIRTYDYSEHAITMRWQAGERAAAEALRTQGAEQRSQRGYSDMEAAQR
jgi:NTE family protein